jgi:FecR protein
MGRCDLGPGSDPTEAGVHGNRDDLDDAELAELVDYLSKELPPARKAAVRRRLETDAAYALRAGPVLSAWTLDLERPPRLGDALRRESETRAAWHVVRRRIAAIAGTSSAEVSDEPAALERADRDVGAAARRRALPVRWRRRVYRTIVMPAVLSFIVFVVGVYGHGLYLILGPGWVQGHMWRAVHQRLHRPIVDVVTNHANAQLVRMPDGSTAVLDLMTWLSYPEHMGDVARNVRLTGRARFTVAPGRTFPFEVGAGPAVLRGGTEYTVDYTDPSHPVTVWVTRGDLTVRLASDEDERPIVVSAGHVARVTPAYIQVDTAVAPPPAF